MPNWPVKGGRAMVTRIATVHVDVTEVARGPSGLIVLIRRERAGAVERQKGAPYHPDRHDGRTVTDLGFRRGENHEGGS